MVPIWVWFALIPSILAIAVIDWIILGEWFRCEECGHKAGKWYSWIIPTTLEVLLFLSGIAIGGMME